MSTGEFRFGAAAVGRGAKARRRVADRFHGKGRSRFAGALAGTAASMMEPGVRCLWKVAGSALIGRGCPRNTRKELIVRESQKERGGTAGKHRACGVGGIMASSSSAKSAGQIND